MSARWAGTYLLVFTAFAPGQFIAATAMLPQSFVLVCLQFAHAAWLEASTETDSKVASRLGLPLGGYSSAIWWAAVAALVCDLILASLLYIDCALKSVTHRSVVGRSCWW
jgi:hypothetical protein